MHKPDHLFLSNFPFYSFRISVFRLVWGNENNVIRVGFDMIHFEECLPPLGVEEYSSHIYPNLTFYFPLNVNLFTRSSSSPLDPIHYLTFLSRTRI